ncbi:MAG: nicotinamide-nucleotide amidohydrolase family protein [Actinobacteria bacterium]|nr:nicotinamide-nucleotide amidohydrolase family protein [Actinomycetota bacterium]MCG2808716.1 nicotinamide-nucleotide amidohydrolase family protein [Coriobacteriia bacterium]
MAASAAIVTVGTEITTGLRLDTNTREIAAALMGAGYDTRETVSLPDDPDLVATCLRRLVAAYDLVVVTGGLGPTHDDITREAASEALGLPMSADPGIAHGLARWVHRHTEQRAREQVLRQALVLQGAEVLAATVGTAPGQVVQTPLGGRLVLLPGPPNEMRPMLQELFAHKVQGSSTVVEIACTGISESDAQVATQAALAEHPGVRLTILASPADVHVVLFDDGAGNEGILRAAESVRDALVPYWYSDDGASLASVVTRLAQALGMTLAVAESCTGGLVAASLTSVPGASSVFRGGVVAYSNEVKTSQLDVPEALIAKHGAVSGQVASAMARGVLRRLGTDVSVAITGIAGPDGGSADKPVGTVWFSVADASGEIPVMRQMIGDRDGIRTRATMFALNLLRLKIAGHE